LGYKNFSARGVQGAQGPRVNLGPPNVSESRTARKLKLKTALGIVTDSPREKKFPLEAYRGHRAP